MSLLQVVYVSTLVADKPEILSKILDAAIKNNKRNNITGMLLYVEGSIIQALEGESNDVARLLATIQQDTRHRGMEVLIQEEILSRKFASWNMGFRRLSAADLKKFPASTPLFHVHDGEVALRIRPSNALTLLTTFVEVSK